jgi:hypothetical protein
MMLIFGISLQPISAQIRIQGLVTDAENRGIASVSVGIPGTKFGTATSSDGRFELVADDSETDSELCFHRMSYATRCIPIRTISGELKVTLANQPIPMPEVIVTPYARINPRRVVNHAAAEFKKRRHTDLYVSDAAYVEKATCGGRSCMFTEGVGYLVSFGTHSPIRLDEYSFLSTNMRKSDRGAEWLDLTRNSARNLGMRHQSDMPPGYNFALNAVARFEVGGPLTRPDRYRYFLVQSAEIPSDEIHIAFRPNRPYGLYQGILILDRFLWQIRSVELTKTSFYSSWMFKEVTASGRIAYQLVDHRVSLHSLEFVIPTNDVVVDITLRSGVPRDPGNAITPRDYNVLSHNDRNPYVRYDESTWPDTNLDSMAEQFRKNSAQPFLHKVDAHGKRIGVTGGEATYKRVSDIIDDILAQRR